MRLMFRADHRDYLPVAFGVWFAGGFAPLMLIAFGKWEWEIRFIPKCRIDDD